MGSMAGRRCRALVLLSERLGELSAPLVGALGDEVIMGGSTTANLHQLAATFLNRELAGIRFWRMN